MPTSEELFIREFRDTTRILDAQVGVKRGVKDIPNVLKGKVSVNSFPSYKVHGVIDETFECLNGNEVRGMGTVIPEISVRDSAGRKKVDLHGNVVKERPVTPTNSIFIRSKVKVDIPFRWKPNDFNWAEAWSDAPDGFKYIYAVPKENLFRMNTTALAVSSHPLKCYSGYKFQTWSQGKLNVAVIPYRPNAKYIDTVILGTKPDTEWGSEIKEYVNNLIELGIIPNIPDYDISGYRNLVMQELAPSYDEFIPESELSLVEEKGLSYDMAASMYAEEPVVEEVDV